MALDLLVLIVFFGGVSPPDVQTLAQTNPNQTLGGPARSAQNASPASPKDMTAVEHASDRPDEAAALDELEKAVQEAEKQTEAFRSEVRKIGEFSSKQSSDALRANNEQVLQGLEQEQAELRTAAIARFETFVRKYPHSSQRTPEAMSKLAMLYFENSEDILDKQRQSYAIALSKWDPSSGLPAPAEPAIHYEQTIDLMERVIAGFPDYRLVDGAYYLLGYCLSEQGEKGRALVAFNNLVRRVPNSRYAAEVWTRIGEINFAENKLNDAIPAYAQVLQFADSPYYDKALYKLAWTHYRLGDPDRAPAEFQKAVDTFVQLIDLNEKSKEEDQERAGDLRPESLRYVAIAYAEERWGGLDKMIQYFKRLGGRPYEREALMELGNTYFGQTRFAEAIAAFRKALEVAPNDPSAPLTQERIVAAYERQRDFASAARERRTLTSTYISGTPWYEHNRENPEALASVDKLVTQSLMSAAVFFHRQAQSYREGKRFSEAKEEYARAASAYGVYLQRYPNDKGAYNVTFSYAECLFYSEQFLKAAEAYALVRDSQTNNKLQEEAAFSVVSSFESAVKAAEAKGEIKPVAVLRRTDRKDLVKIEPRPIPELKQKMIAAADVFATIMPSSKKVPSALYAAAEIYYTYDDFEEARKRFLVLIDKYPNAEVARYAANLVIESYLAQQDFIAVEAFAQSMLTAGKISDPNFVAVLKRFSTGTQFEMANVLAGKGEYEQAAEKYIKLVDSNPRNEFADKALNNAAVAFEKAKRFDSASRTYERLIRDYPRSALADTALFRIGLNAEHFFDFDKAISAYMQLQSRYVKSDKRADALYNAATALENTQRYNEAAVQFERYCKLFPRRNDAAQVCFRAGSAIEKTGRWPQVIKTFNQFVKKFRKDADNKDRVLEAMVHIAKAQTKLGHEGIARKIYGEAVKLYKSKGGDTQKSAPFAAEAEFNMIDAGFARFRKMPVKGTGKQQAKALVAKAKTLSQLQDKYLEVLQFKNVDWTLASLFRVGELYQNFAESMVNAPCPPDVKKAARKMKAAVAEVCDEYRVLLEEKAANAEGKAVGAYEKGLEKAKELQVANEWTQRTRVALNKLRRAEYPLQKDAKTFVDVTAIESPPLIGQIRASPSPKAPAVAEPQPGS